MKWNLEFRPVFIAILISASLIFSALLFHTARPQIEISHYEPNFTKATGKCAACHVKETSAIVRQYETSKHAQVGVNCYSCHKALDGQKKMEHRGFFLTAEVTPKNCAQCHTTEHNQYLKSRHAAPAWAAVHGKKHFTKEQIAHAEKFHKGAVNRPGNQLATLEGESAIVSGCEGCHNIGKPNHDLSIGKCSPCHSKHSTSLRFARNPQTCGQCHMGPDHSQIEIYNESPHGALFAAQSRYFNLDADPKKLTTRDMSVPTCATCHMSGLEGQKVTHDVTERLSYWLFAAISEKRPHFDRAKAEMQETCSKCHATSKIEHFYEKAEAVVQSTNKKVQTALYIMKKLRQKGLITSEPFDEPIEFLYFDLWHYYGRTAKHGAYMGGPDFVQWHGNYELLLKLTKLKKMAKALEDKKK